MTIGSTYNHPADVATPLAGNAEGWSARFPNPPDLCFDYRRLLEQVGGIAQARRAEQGFDAFDQRAAVDALPAHIAGKLHPAL